MNYEQHLVYNYIAVFSIIIEFYMKYIFFSLFLWI